MRLRGPSGGPHDYEICERVEGEERGGRDPVVAAAAASSVPTGATAASE
jgi:hypothetical protein